MFPTQFMGETFLSPRGSSMRTLLVPWFLLGFFLASDTVRADDKEVADLIDKAIKAHGGADKLTKEQPTRSKGKGTLELGGGLSMTQETVLQGGKFKETLILDVNGQEVVVTTVYDGAKAWIKAANQDTMELDGKLLEAIKEASYATRVGRLVFLKDKAVQMSALGEIKIDDKPAVGVKVSSKGHRDVDMFFDKKSGLLVKVVKQVYDAMKMEEVTEERFISEYQEADGVKVPKKVLLHRDGKKFMEMEILEIKHPEKIDDSEFAKP
jgi:hypothetical protein